jgi:hypothetical protein
MMKEQSKVEQSMFTVTKDGKFVVSAINCEASIISYMDICGGVRFEHSTREHLEHAQDDAELMAGMLTGACIRNVPYDVNTMSDIKPEVYAKRVKEAANELAAVLELAVGEFFDQVRHIPKGVRLASEAIAESAEKCKNACSYNDYWTMYHTEKCKDTAFASPVSYICGGIFK